MKKLQFFYPLLILCFFVVSGCTKKSENGVKNAKELIVYTYDSFSGEWGSGPNIAKAFEEKTGIKVTYVDCGDGIEILSKAISEKKSPYADILLGLDNNLTDRVIESNLLLEYKPKNADAIISADLSSELNKNGSWLMTPYDYSHFAMIFDTASELPEPKSLEDLTKSIYSKKIILMDPRTSTPGLGFDTWVRKIYGASYDDYMQRLASSILVKSPSWSTGYGMFTNGEAPLVISYTTSPAYHLEYGEGNQYKALIFEQGHVRQIEGAGILKSSKNLKEAKAFIDYLVSDEAQSLLPLGQWMFPVNNNVELPESYKVAAPIPAVTLK